jgi:soluble lytic murein transglycosylase-like protein
MTLMKRLRVGISVLALSMIAVAAQAGAPQALSSDDARAYAAAFAASDRGDFIDAQMQSGAVQDKSLLGYLSFHELMHPTAHIAAFDELAGWLGSFRDLPVANRIFALASRRKPDPSAQVPTPVIALADGPAPQTAVSERGRRAREAFYAGNARRALELAPAAGERWIAGLAAYRLKDYGRAQAYFADLARDELTDAWTQSAAGYWAARAAQANGDGPTASRFLALAARNSETFYGMIAQRQAQLQGRAVEEAGVGKLILTAYAPVLPSAAPSDLAQFVATDARAHRAAALAQIGRAGDSLQELRAGIALATTEQARARWRALTQAMGQALADRAQPPRLADLDYPTPELQPISGFTVDKALVYAIVRQESRFDPDARSPVGAVGLMQLMPQTAARAAGDDKLKADMSPLRDPAYNLRVGQDYLTWLMERGVGHDLLRTVAAYNGGPATVARTAQMLGDDADGLLLVECLPAQETRNYVQKVLAGYWTYRKMWGEDARTLDALASGARVIDPRLDFAGPAEQMANASAPAAF